MNKPIRWGILGTSFISEVMADAIQHSENSKLLALGSRSIKTAEPIAKKFKIPRIYNDYHQLMADPDIDVVYIGLPNHLHKTWVLNAAESGKHSLCEKTLAMNVAEVREIIHACEKHQLVCMEAFMYRHHPFTKKLKELVSSKVIGDIKLYTASYTANISGVANPVSGGSIRNLGCYPVSLIRYLANAEPTEMSALGRINTTTGNDHQASLMLKFPDDSIGMISTADDLEMFWQFDMYGTKGNIKLISNPWLPAEEQSTILISRSGNDRPEEIHVSAGLPLYTYQIDAMNRLITNQEAEGISLSDSLGNVRVLDQWLDLVHSNKFHLTPSLVKDN